MNPFASHKILAHLPILGDYLRGDVYPPIQVEIDVTNLCTSACPWCAGYHEREDHPFILFGAGATKAEQWGLSRLGILHLLRDLAEYGVKSVTWTGGGDPSLHPYLSEFVERAALMGLDNGLITNGVVPITDCVPWCQWIRFSVDAGTKETYARQHGRAHHFDKVLANIRETVAAKTRHGYPTTIGVACVTSQDVVGELEDFVRLWHDVAVDYIQFRPLLDTHGKTFFSDNVATIEAIRRAAALDPRVVSSEAKYAGLAGSGQTSHCHGVFLESAIAADGCVYVCCHLKGNPRHSLGSLHEESFRTIWERHLSNRTFKVQPECPALCRHYGTNRFFEDEVLCERDHENFI